MPPTTITVDADFTVTDDGGDFQVQHHDTQKQAESDLKFRKRYYKALRLRGGLVKIVSKIK